MKKFNLAVTIFSLFFGVSLYSEEKWGGVLVHQEVYDWENSHETTYDIALEYGVYKELILVEGKIWQTEGTSLEKDKNLLEGNSFIEVLFLSERTRRKRESSHREELPNSFLENPNPYKNLTTLQLDWGDAIVSNGFRDIEIMKYITRLKGSDPYRNTELC